MWLSGLKRQTQKNCWVEKSGTRMCAWIRIPILSENVLKTMRQSLELTNSVILERQFKMTVQSKRKQKNRNVIRGWYPSNFKVPKKEDTQPRHYKHECTRGLRRKSFEKGDTNRLADYISEMQIRPNWKSTDHTEKSRGKPGRTAERSKAPGSRNSSVEKSGTRVCAGFESYSCHKTFWTQ